MHRSISAGVLAPARMEDEGSSNTGSPGAPRRRVRMPRRSASEQPCCMRDEGRPLGAAVQAEASNHPLLLCSRDMVVSELGKGRARPCQVWIVELNVSESPMTCRKRLDDVRTGAAGLLRDKLGRYLFTVRAASGMKVARTRSWLLCGTWEPVVSMPRENRKWRSHERESTDAEHRGGALCSSDEGLVMRLERRECPMSSGTTKQPESGGL